MNSKIKIFYIAETSTYSQSAYIIHVLKMCDAFSLNKINTKCILPFQKNEKYKSIKNDFLLRSKKRIQFKSIFKKKQNNNFFNRFLFSFKVAIYLNNKKKNIILTRSQLSSVFLSLFKIKHFLEIHGELKGVSKFLLLNLNFINSKYIIKNIFITHKLRTLHFLNVKNFLILPDAVDIKNFKKRKKANNIKKFCYIGNFYSGRGIEKIFKLAKFFKNYSFDLYGNKDSQKNYIYPKNLKIYNFVKYKFVPDLLSKYDVLLMPYEEHVTINSKSLNTSRYMSPLKMFDYLAAGKIIISSNQKVLREILKNNFNCFIVKKNSIKGWINIIKNLENKSNLNKITLNAIQTANKYTWINRAKKIENIYFKNTSNE